MSKPKHFLCRGQKRHCNSHMQTVLDTALDPAPDRETVVFHPISQLSLVRGEGLPESA